MDHHAIAINPPHLAPIFQALLNVSAQCRAMLFAVVESYLQAPSYGHTTTTVNCSRPTGLLNFPGMTQLPSSLKIHDVILQTS